MYKNLFLFDVPGDQFIVIPNSLPREKYKFSKTYKTVHCKTESN
jgi:hypothetical protein